jgi:hypothetical protein
MKQLHKALWLLTFVSCITGASVLKYALEPVPSWAQAVDSLDSQRQGVQRTALVIGNSDYQKTGNC